MQHQSFGLSRRKILFNEKKKTHLCGDTTLEDISQNVSSESKIELRWDNETGNLGQFKAAYFTLFTTSNYFP